MQPNTESDFVYKEEYERRRRLLMYTIYITFPITGSYAALFYYNQVYVNSFIQMFCCVGFICLLFLLEKRIIPETIAWFYISLAAISIYVNTYFTGGLMSIGLGWMVSHPPVALMIGSKRHGYVAAIADLLYIFILAAMHGVGHEFPPTSAQFTSTISNIFSGFIGLFSLMFLVSLVFENSKNRALQKLADKNKIVENERQRSDALLLNILPVTVADELKAKGSTTAKRYNEVSILFCDFITFSKVAESLPPEDLVIMIDSYFRAFDDIMDKYGIEKIKTVGDAYLAASGLPDERKHDVIKLVGAAQEMLAFVKQHLSDERHFGIRIGINTGTVVAGVVGRAKFAYDIWGDAVNIAARMEQNCEPNSINISESTFQLIASVIPCTYRGEMEAKNMGKLKMYSVNQL